MRYVEHGPAPDFLRGWSNEFDQLFGDWKKMLEAEQNCRKENHDHCHKIRDLRQFLARVCGAVKGRGSSDGPICTYCEQRTAYGKNNSNPATIDHFRPVNHDETRYRYLTFMWENLVYTCECCNSAKENKFPYAIGGYVSPTDSQCHSYFGYDFDNLKIRAAENIDSGILLLRILRTICDFNLNRQTLIDERARIKRNIDKDMAVIDGRNLGQPITDEEKRRKLRSYTRPSRPFRNFARAYGVYLGLRAVVEATQENN